MGNFNRSVQRCLAVLRSFRSQLKQTLTSIANETGLPHPTVLRLLGTLEEEGYVRRDQGLWTLTPQILEIGFAALHSMGVDQFVQGALQSLADEFSGIVNLGEKNNDEVIIIARATGAGEQRSLFIMNQRVGNTLPASSALYRALNVTENEWSMSRYPDHHVVSVGIPVTHGEPRSLALGISVSIQAFTPERIEHEVIPRARQVRKEIRRLMHLGDI